MLAHQNTYNSFRTNNNVDKNNELYHDNNLIMLNAIEIAKSKNNYNAFTLKLTKDPNFPSSVEKFKSNLSNQGFYKRYDVAEVLRGDYLNQLSDFLDKLNLYNSKENNNNMQYLGLMIALLHYNSQQDSLMSSMSIIDYCN